MKSYGAVFAERSPKVAVLWPWRGPAEDAGKSAAGNPPIKVGEMGCSSSCGIWKRAVILAPEPSCRRPFSHGGDVHEANGVLTHYDFDCCGLGLRIYDLATFKWDAALSGTEEQRWSHFLEGDRSVRDFSDSKLELLYPFVVIRHFWWVGQMLGKVGGFEHDMTDNESIDDYLRYLKRIVSKDDDAE